MTTSIPPSLPSREVVASIVPLLKAISDQSRLAILVSLADESKTVVELTEELTLSQPLVSHHLKALREVGLISLTPEGRSNRYTLCCDAVAQPIHVLNGLANATAKNPPEGAP